MVQRLLIEKILPLGVGDFNVWENSTTSLDFRLVVLLS